MNADVRIKLLCDSNIEYFGICRHFVKTCVEIVYTIIVFLEFVTAAPNTTMVAEVGMRISHIYNLRLYR